MSPCAELLRSSRLSAGLTQRDLARRARTSAAAVNRYEKGSVAPSLATLRRLLESCGLMLRLEAVPVVPDPVIVEDVRLMRQRPLELRLDDLNRLDRMAKAAVRVAS